MVQSVSSTVNPVATTQEDLICNPNLSSCGESTFELVNKSSRSESWRNWFFILKRHFNFQYQNSCTIGFSLSQSAPKGTTPRRGHFKPISCRMRTKQTSQKPRQKGGTGEGKGLLKISTLPDHSLQRALSARWGSRCAPTPKQSFKII